MAIFTNDDVKSKDNNTNTTIITIGASIKGEINLTCNLYVDGEIDGIIKSQNNVHVGKNGRIKGEIIAKSVIVQGKINGTIDANRVEIKAHGHIMGTVISSELVIESKGIFEGDSKIKDIAKPQLNK